MPDRQQPVSIVEEMRRSYLDYAMSVIIGRALPDTRDGLKPVHRRVLFTMQEMGLAWNRAYKKSARVVGDETRLRQVLLNLAGNAIKFTEQGGVALVVEPGAWPGEVLFKVRDTGIGIAAADQSRIFGEFEQGEAGAGQADGTGLGLAITKRIVEGMQGRIAVESAPGAGALFEAAVPLPPANATIGTSVGRSTNSPAGRITSIAPPGASESIIQLDMRPAGTRFTVVVKGSPTSGELDIE